MAERTCHNCVYACHDPLLWLRCEALGEPLLPRRANHPWWPGRLHDVPRVPCRNYRPRPALPQGDDVRMIPVGNGCYAYVDAADYEWLRQWTWSRRGGYAVRQEKGRCIFMHREIMQPAKGMIVDHADGNRANNCRRNLRTCTHQQNTYNRRTANGSSSIFKGVHYDKDMGAWGAVILAARKYRRLGRFDNEIEAARAYDAAAVRYFREYARLNFPEEWPPERRAAVYAEQDAIERRTENRRQRTEDRRRRTAGQKKATAGKQKAKGGGQRTADRGRRTEDGAAEGRFDASGRRSVGAWERRCVGAAGFPGPRLMTAGKMPAARRV